MNNDLDSVGKALVGAVPPEPAQLFRLQRLCVRLYIVLTGDIGELIDKLVKAAGCKWPKQQRQLGDLLAAELPILMLLRVLGGLERDKLLGRPEFSELMRGLLMPLFALGPKADTERPSQRIKRVLDRIDWYLDQEDTIPVDAFGAYCTADAAQAIKNPAEFTAMLRDEVMPEVDRRLTRTLVEEFL